MIASAKQLEERACSIRATCIQMAHDGKEGHLCSALSPVDVLVALFYSFLNIEPKTPKQENRDRFILSKGHGCASLYAIMADQGFFPKEKLSEYNRAGAMLPNHPCLHALPSLEMSSGSLGHGLGVGTGMAYGLQLRNSGARVVVLAGDGECNEGSIWESAAFAAAHRMEKLLFLVDYNGIQAVGRSDEIMGFTSLEDKFRSFGWGATTVDGHDMEAILAALGRFPFKPGSPSAIIAKTRTGVSFMENDVLWHYRKPSVEDLQRSLTELGAQPIHRTTP